MLECASFCAEPYGGKESVLGEITMDDVKVTAMLPEQRCTVASVAGHAMYERANPFYEHFLGGHIDMSQCRYEQYDERTVRVTGPRYVPATELRVKLEGAGKIGERYVGIVGVRDPYTIANIDLVTAWARQQVAERFGDSGYELHFTVYGRDAILGDREPLKSDAGARARHRRAGGRADQGDGRGGVHDRDAADVLRPPAAGERHRRRRRLSARRGDAGEPGLSLDAQSHDAARRSARTVSDLHRRGGGMMASRKLSEIAKTIRSKNAGVDKITFDVIFPDRATYDRVRDSGVLSREAVCRIFGIDPAQITDHVEFDPALAIKFTIIPPDAERQPRRRRHLRQPAIRSAARHRGAGKSMTD